MFGGICRTVNITTLLGKKHKLDVSEQDTFKDLKKQLYISGKVSRQIRLFEGKTALVDDWKVQNRLTNDATISAVDIPAVDINIEVNTGPRVHKLRVSNSTSVMVLKIKIIGFMRWGVAPEKLEMRLGDVTLEDSMPLHFYGITNGSKVDAVKIYIGVIVENNNGTQIYWCLDRRETIRDVKVQLIETLSSLPTNLQGTHLYLVRPDQKYDELIDHKTVANYDIKDGDNLYLLSYKWSKKCYVVATKSKRKLQGVEREDSCLGIKVKAQDQLGTPVSALKLFHVKNDSYKLKDYYNKEEIADEYTPFIQMMGPLVAFTEEEVRAE